MPELESEIESIVPSTTRCSLVTGGQSPNIRWVKAYSRRRNDSLIVAKLLLKELIPRYGLPMSLESDRGTHFHNEVMKMLCSALQIDQRFHCNYRPDALALWNR